MNPDSVETVSRVPHGGEPDRSLLDFSANTNPRIPDRVIDVYADALETARRYPDDAYPDYRAAVSDYVGCSENDVIPTPGGLAAIRLTLEACLEPGETVLVPAPSFGEYAREVRLQGATPRFVPHDELCEVDDVTLLEASLVIICTPNNPTGELTPRSRVETFADRCRAAETTLLVDEAFLGFTDEPSMAGHDDHVVVARSLTKLFGLPGLRAGFAVATGEIRERLEIARRAWNLGTPTAAVGAHCMRQTEFVRGTRREVAEERERMTDTLAADDRYEVTPSDAPFLLLEVIGDEDVDSLCRRTREAGVVIRDATSFRGLDSHVRVAIKDRASNDRLLEVLTDG
ncbi:threonine-phosphate decarboxylase CobD [Natronosalvus vescus]|uniref:threonine-phosphate decarboxylase CobD n=1 Tax=Natronosalvus vescus TaxID=2953881 RepID=UPI002090580F|nr:threonine-phosphate decarboxylase CobD [Natronosalvus vescus]